MSHGDQLPCSSTNFENVVELSLIDSPSVSSIPEASSSDKVSTKKPNGRPSECAVCTKPTSGYHYDVASCHGCKTFFRRVLISEKSFVCKLDKDCFDLTKHKTPMRCRACRYLKCIELGMNPNAVKVDEVEAQAENFKKLSKRVAETEGKDDEDVIEIEKAVVSQFLVKKIYSVDVRKQKMVEMLTYLEYKVELFQTCAYNPNVEFLPGLEILLQEHNKISVTDKEGPMPNWPLKQPTGPPPPPPPDHQEGGSKKSFIVHDPQKKMWFVYDLLTTVEYAKTFEFFHKLDMRDRILLLKYVALVIMNLHISYFSMKKHFDRVIHPDGIVPPERHGMMYSQKTMSIVPLIRYSVSSKEYILLKAICLCNPAVPDLSRHAQEILLAERELYASALFDHCLQDSKLGPSHFAHLIGIIDTLEHQQKIQKDFHVLVTLPMAKQFAPIMLIDDIMNS